MQLQKSMDSSIDHSKNFIFKNDKGEIFEARYVRREDDYFICYLSTHSGCLKACKFCHLTRSGQTDFTHATAEDLGAMTDTVFSHYRSQPSASVVHFDFMVRGEPLANRHILKDGFEILSMLVQKAKNESLIPKFNVSTIMPVETKNIRIAKVFSGLYPTIYYSLYSMDQVFRKEWLPQALAAEKALDILAEYQKDSGKIITIHGCVIANSNDSSENWHQIVEAVAKRNLSVKFNLVKYNPFGAEIPGGIAENGPWGEASGDAVMENIASIVRQYGPAQVVKRVGFDIKASCGMFVSRD